MGVLTDNSTTTNRNLSFLEKQFRPSFCDLSGPEQGYKSVILMDINSFKERVIQLREVYDQFSRNGHLPDFSHPECDPWSDIPACEVEPMVRTRMEAILQAAAKAHAGAAAEKLEAAAELRRLQESSGDMGDSVLPLQIQMLDSSGGLHFSNNLLETPAAKEEVLPLADAGPLRVDDNQKSKSNSKERKDSRRRKKEQKEMREIEEEDLSNSQIKACTEIIDAARGELHGRAVKLQALETDLARKDAVITEILTLAHAASLQLQSVKDVSRLRAVQHVDARRSQRCLGPVVGALRKMLDMVD